MAIFEFSEPTNEIGTYLPSGLRTGPSYQAFGPVTSGPSYGPTNPTGRSLSYGYGPGVLNGSLCWYRINPASPANSIINSGVLISTLSVGSEIPLQTNTTTGRGTQYFINTNSAPGIQMDFPRAVSLSFTGFSATSSACTGTIRFTGIDVWGQNLVSDMVFSIAAAAADNSLNFYTPSAFFQLIGNPVLTAYSAPTGTSTNATLVLSAGNYFGLPYFLESEGNITTYVQYSMALGRVGSYIHPVIYSTATGAQPKASTLYAWATTGILGNGSTASQLLTGSAQQQSSNVYIGSSVTPTATTGDVRGMISPNQIVKSTNSGGYSLVSGDDFQNEGAMEILYTVAGADYLLYQYGQLMNTIQSGLTLNAGADWTGFGKAGVMTSMATPPSIDQVVGVVPYGGS